MRKALGYVSVGSVALTFIGGVPAHGADMPIKAPLAAPVATGPWVELFGGVTAAPDSIYGEGGAVFAFNRNLRTDGWLLRLKGGGGHYEYNRAPGVTQGVDFQVGDFMVGYQKFYGTTRVSGYLGANVENHDNPDPLATVKGTEWGVKVQGEIFMPLNNGWYIFALGNYSSAFNNYFTQAKAGYSIAPGIAIGPEFMALGNDRFDAVRLGPFASFDVGGSTQLILSGGYSWDTRSDSLNDHSGGYFNAHIRTTF
ncbi:MAG: cellulose biosynthesis protein BcsS [Xanthobacteraceae bacterium]